MPAKQPEQPETPPAAVPTRVKVIIHPRRSAVYDVQIGTQIVDGKEVPVLAHRLALGGETIEISAHDAAHLEAHGFLATPEILAAYHGAAAELAATSKGDQVIRHTLREEVAGNYGLQRPTGQTDAW